MSPKQQCKPYSLADREFKILLRKIVTLNGVVAIREVMTGDENVHIEVVGIDGNDLSRIGRDLNEIGLKVVDEDIIRNEYTRPFHQFSTDAVVDDS